MGRADLHVRGRVGAVGSSVVGNASICALFRLRPRRERGNRLGTACVFRDGGCGGAWVRVRKSQIPAPFSVPALSGQRAALRELLHIYLYTKNGAEEIAE